MSRCLAAIVLLLAAGPVAGENWPSWRGPRGDGSSWEKNIPVRFGPKENVVWSVEIPGTGYSSPVIHGDRIFLTSCLTQEGKTNADRVLICLDRKSGKEVWRQVAITATLERKHSLNSYASATPATDGERVYVSFLAGQDMQVFCYSVDGKKLWNKSPGKLLSVHGFCSSPILHRDLVILNGDQDARAFIVALDKKDGSEKWRADRPNRKRSYCTPVLIADPVRKGMTQLVLSGSKCVTGYDADSGELLWIHDGPTEQYVASLVLHQGVLFLTTGFPEYHLMGIRPEGRGNITNSKHVAWHIDMGKNGRNASYVPSPCASDGCFFVVADQGTLNCHQASDGKTKYQVKLGRRHSSSPVLVEGNLIIPDDDGKVFIVKAGPKYQLVEKNDMKETIYASPAVSNGQLYLRTLTKLYCIGREAPSR